MKIPKHWTIQRLGELCEVKGGKRLPKGGEFSDSGHPYIRARDIRNGKITFDDPVYIDSRVREKIARYTVAADDICITIVGINVGDAGIVPSFLDEANLTENAAKLTKLRGIIPRYLNYYLQIAGMKEQMRLFSSGAAQDKLGLYKIKLLDLICPPAPTQSKIAAILTAYDDLIENNRQRIALLEKMAEEIYREWFVRLRFPGHEHTPVHKGVPEGWEVGKLAEVARMVFGQSPPSEYYNQVEDGLPFHQGVGSYGDRFPVHDTYCSVDGRTAEAGSILFSVRAPVGRLNITDRKVILGRGLAGLNEKAGRNSYLWQLLKSSFSREDLIGNGAIFASVGKKELEAFPIFRPPEDLINKFEKLAAPFDDQITGLNSANKVLNATCDLFLNRLISGKLRVDDLEIQFPPSMQEEAA